MAKVLAKKATDKTIVGESKHILVDPALVVAGPDNPRTIHDAEKDKQLKAHMAMGGYVPPILVYRNEAGQLETIDGNRRLTAAKALKQQGHFEDGISAILVDESDKLKRLAMALNANEGVALNTIDRLNAYKQFADAGWTGKEIANELSLSAGAISQGLDIIRYCGKDTLAALKSGSIKFMAAYEIAQQMKRAGKDSQTTKGHGIAAPNVDPKLTKGHEEKLTKAEQDLLKKAEQERQQELEQQKQSKQMNKTLAQAGISLTPAEKNIVTILTKQPDGGVAALLTASHKAIMAAKKLVPSDAERGTKARYDAIAKELDSLIDYYNENLAPEEQEEPTKEEPKSEDTNKRMSTLKGLLGKKAA